MRRWWKSSGGAGSFFKYGWEGFTDATKPILSALECTSHLGFSLVLYAGQGVESSPGLAGIDVDAHLSKVS